MPQSFINTLVQTLYRKPELYKYAKAEKLDYSEVTKGQLTVDQFNDKQQDLNIEAQGRRTQNEISGKLEIPTWWQRVFTSYFST